jgi:hypothetical protein
VLYLANPCVQTVVQAMTDGRLGFIDTPAQGNIRPPDVTWCADNGCFGTGYPGDATWFAWLEDNAHAAGSCLFATAPDVVGDAVATLTRSLPWLPRIRALGYPAALVAQDGLESLETPWDEFDVLFIGGSTGWKLGRHARALVREARLRGKHVHMGRVNSARRWRYAEHIGCDSVDGTYLVFGPDANLPRLLAWDQPNLFEHDARRLGNE